MSRASILLASAAHVVIVTLSACAGVSDGDGGDEVACDSPLDCALGESCRDGVCTAEPSDGGGEGEGEGESNEDEIIARACERLSQCQGESVQSCIAGVGSQLDQIRSRGTDICLRAAEASLSFFGCLGALTCDQINSDPFGFCPVGNEANDLQNLCFNSGPGEGEGEGEGEQECFSDADCGAGAFCIDGKCAREEP